jgi:hypothetical protein
LYYPIGFIGFGYKWISENVRHNYGISPEAGKKNQISNSSGGWGLIGIAPATGQRTLSPHFVISSVLVSNFIGVAFARTLHYQFYCWYFHSLPYILWACTSLPTVVSIAIMVAIEIAFNVYPATWWSSLVLQV